MPYLVPLILSRENQLTDCDHPPVFGLRDLSLLAHESIVFGQGPYKYRV